MLKPLTQHEAVILSEIKAVSILREAETKLQMVRAHDAAGFGRRFDRQNDRPSTANSGIGSELEIMRRRSLNMIANNGWATQAQNVLANGIVGTGIRPSVRKGHGRKKQEEKILAFFTDWSQDHNCDHEGRESFAGIQQKIIRTTIATGECIVRRHRLDNGGFKIQVQEGDYIDGSRHTGTMTAEGYTMHGIDYDSSGRVLAYWLFDTLEYDSIPGALTSKRVPAVDVCHVFYADRAGQRRGLPWLRNVYLNLMDMSKFMDADLQRAIVAACHAAFITKQDVGSMGFEVNTPEDRILSLEPGIVEYLAANEMVTFNTPPTHSNFNEYVQTILRSIASGMGITYESLSGDYSQVNFSSAKMGSNEMDRNFSEKRERVMLYALNRVWEWFMESLSRQRMIAQNVDEAKAIKADWTAPRRAMIDMYKETNGIKSQMEAGLISPQEAIRMIGGDPSDVTAEIASMVEIVKGIDFVPSWNVKTEELKAKKAKAAAPAPPTA